MGLFGDAHGCGREGGKKPYLKKIQKYMNYVTQPLSFSDISVFSSETNKYCYINKQMHVDTIFLILLTFFDSLKIFSIKMVAILIKIVAYCRFSWNKGILKKISWLHNFCPWRHQPNFITWLELYCIRGHGIKVW